MKNILVLVSNSNPNKEQFQRKLRQELDIRGACLTFAKFDDIFINLGERGIELLINGHDIKEYDCVYFRRVGPGFSPLAATIAVILDHYKIKYFDSTWNEIGPMGDKFTSLTRLFFAGIPIPHTVYYSSKNAEKIYEMVSKSLGSPFVAKDLEQQRGKGIFLVKDDDELQKIEKDESKKVSQFMYQEYVKNPKEFRILVLGNRARVWEEKIAQNGEFRSNVALGAKEVFMQIDKLPEEFEKASVKAAVALGIDIAGVDIMKVEDRFYVLEVNRGPGFTYDNDESFEIANLADFLTESLPSTPK